MKDKQLNVELEVVMEKRRLDQALSIKEFAIAAGISYSVARNWFRSPGFPTFRNVVFWQDFVQWRSHRMGLPQEETSPAAKISRYRKYAETMAPRHAKMMIEVDEKNESLKALEATNQEMKQSARVAQLRAEVGSGKIKWSPRAAEILRKLG